MCFLWMKYIKIWDTSSKLWVYTRLKRGKKKLERVENVVNKKRVENAVNKKTFIINSL